MSTEYQGTISFLQLLSQFQLVKIPVIQRDYAQGRMDEQAKEVRSEFLEALIDSLRIERQPLVLDFVYGSVDRNLAFTVLDGQQRLTTLFLMHWYLAPDEEVPSLAFTNDSASLSKFSYQTRIASKEFCNALIKTDYSSVKGDLLSKADRIRILLERSNSELAHLNNDENGRVQTPELDELRSSIQTKIQSLQTEIDSLTFSGIIRNSPWFMWAWRKDPTVKAMLVMLDDLHSRLCELTDIERLALWVRLKKGRIVFHLLPLDKFSLTDELYVKMNARGKELSKFDILKSTLEEQMRIQKVSASIRDLWCKNIDNVWVDIFWNTLAKSKIDSTLQNNDNPPSVRNVEDSYLIFIDRMIAYYLLMHDDCINGSEIVSQHSEGLLDNLREQAVRQGSLSILSRLKNLKFFQDSFFIYLSRAFNSLIFKTTEGERFDGSEMLSGIKWESDPKSIFEAFIGDDAAYDTKVQFFGLIEFFIHHSAEKTALDSTLKDELHAWMRVIRNLTTNTNTYYYNTYRDFQRSILAIRKWAKEIYGHENGSIIKYLVQENNLIGFDGSQIEEEKIKAVLLSQSEESTAWYKAIRRAEEHGYFLGQIRFLLVWSKETVGGKDKYDLHKFNLYVDKITHVFDDHGLKSSLCDSRNHLFRCALLSTTDFYLLNNCFINNTGKDRDTSWKRYLRDNEKSVNIKQLIDKWDVKKHPSFDSFLSDVIKDHTPTDWRKFIVNKPEMFKELTHDKIAMWNLNSFEIRLLSKTRANCKHKELCTFYWHLKYKQAGDSYHDSTAIDRSFSAVFFRTERGEVSVMFIPGKSESENFEPGRYLVTQSSNQKQGPLFEQYFDSHQVEDIEKTLQQLVTKP
jgi:hypothetical protein